MKTSALTLAAFLSMNMPALAQGIGVDASVGGVGIGVSAGSDGIGVSAGAAGTGADVGVGSEGVSAGVDAPGVSAGVDAGSGGISADVDAAGIGIDAAAGSGGVSASVSAPAGIDASVSVSDEGPAAGATVTPGNAADEEASASTAVAAARMAPVPLIARLLDGQGYAALPCSVAPCGDGDGAGKQASPGVFERGPLAAVEGTSPAVVAACREAAAKTARLYGMRDIAASSRGRTVKHEDGTYSAPLTVRIVYSNPQGFEVREAPVDCRMDEAGKVTSFSEA